MASIGNERWLELSPYLDQALALAREERGAWLTRLQIENPSVVPEMRRLLEEHEAIAREHFLEHDACAALSNAGSAGQTIGAYTLHALLGHGGMGTVWLARRSDGRFEGNVAIKLLNFALLGREGGERFRREGSALARLNHPNIARLLDAGISAAAQPYLVIELVPGRRIDEYCDWRKLGIRSRIALFLDVAAAVAHAHAKLIVHRDIKPTNICVSDDGVVKLLDFGIAKLLDGDGTGAAFADLTREGPSALTPDYAAPEQMLGGEITTASDIYALGVLLYVLLAGRHPTGARATSPAERLRALVETEPTPLSKIVSREAMMHSAAQRGATPEKLERALKGDLENIVAKALRKNAADRYATVTALADDLRRYLAREPVSARANSRTYRAGLFMRRHRAGVIAMSAVFAALAGGVIGTAWQAVEAGRQRDIARFQAVRAEASSEFMSLMLEEVGRGDEPLSLRDMLDRAVQLLDKQYGEDPRFVSHMLVELSRRYMDLSSFDKAFRVLERSASIAAAMNDDELLARALCASAHAHLITSIPGAAEAELGRAQAALHRLRRPPVEVQVDCLRAQADLAVHEADTAAAIGLLTTAHDLQVRSGETRGLQYTAVLVDLGGVYLHTGRLPEAYATSVQAAEAFDRNGRGGTLGRITAEANLAVVLNGMGEVLAAARLQRHVMERTIALQEAQAARLSYMVNYAGTLLRLERPAEARDLMLELSEQAREQNGPRWHAAAEFQTGRALFATGDIEQAEVRLAQARQLWKQDPNLNARALLGLAVERVRMDLASGRLDAARAGVDALLRQLNYPQQRTDAALRDVLLVAATVYLKADKPQQADSYASTAYDLSRKMARLSDQSADVGEAAYLRARSRYALGHPDEAKPLLEQAVKSLTNGLGPGHRLTRQAVDLLDGITREAAGPRTAASTVARFI